MGDDYYQRQREEDYYHRQREHDYYRRKRDRDRDDYQREQLFPSGKAPYNPFAAALRVAALVAALWLVATVLSLGEQIATEWWQTVFVVSAVIALLGVAKELVLCLIRCFSTGLSAIVPLISGAVAGLVAATVLHAAGVMGTVAAVLANAPTF